MNKFLETIHDMIEIITGKRPEAPKEEKDIGEYIGLKREKPKRARGKKGKFLSDDPTTKDVNEAWIGGKAPNNYKVKKKSKSKRKK
jgi:hypothetical protein